MPNIEIKAKIDLLKKEFIKSILTTEPQILNQTDVYYKVPNGRLKFRESEDGNCLIPYIRDDDNGIKKSRYCLLKTDNGKECMDILSKMFSTEITVKKVREVYFIENVRIHLDEVYELGSFIEFESVYENDTDESINRNKIDNLLILFDIKQEELIKHSYKELLERNY